MSRTPIFLETKRGHTGYLQIERSYAFKCAEMHRGATYGVEPTSLIWTRQLDPQEHPNL